MQELELRGRSILIVEDEPLIALDIKQAFESVGAKVMTARTLQDAFNFIDKEQPSAAILDHAVADKDSDELCERLKAMSIPFINYTGFTELGDHCDDAPHISKPAPPAVLVSKIVELLH